MTPDPAKPDKVLRAARTSERNTQHAGVFAQPPTHPERNDLDIRSMALAVLSRNGQRNAPATPPVNAATTPSETVVDSPEVLAWIAEATSELDRRAACTSTCWNCGRAEDRGMGRCLYRDAGGFLTCDVCYPCKTERSTAGIVPFSS